jgi:hypothetical protein
LKELEEFKKLVPEKMRGRPRAINVMDRFLMFLVWMRNNCSFHFFALITGISERTCREYCLECLEIISKPAKE